ADVAGVECIEAVLHAHVIHRAAREPGAGVPAEDVDRVVLEGAASPARIGDRVIDKTRRDGRGAAAVGEGRACAGPDQKPPVRADLSRAEVPSPPARDGRLLLEGPCLRRGVEYAIQELAV